MAPVPVPPTAAERSVAALGAMRQILVAIGLVPPWLIPEPGMTTERC